MHDYITTHDTERDTSLSFPTRSRATVQAGQRCVIQGRVGIVFIVTKEGECDTLSRPTSHPHVKPVMF